MTINANYIVSLPPRTIRGGSADLETNGMVLVATDILPSDKPAITVTTAQEAAALVGDMSAVAKFAQQYFTGLNNQQHVPSALVIGAIMQTNQPAWIRSGEHAELAELKAVLDGTISITINGAVVSASEIDLSACNSYSDVAAAVALKLGEGVTGTYNSVLKAFVFKTAETGAGASVTFATGTAAVALGLTEDAGAVLSQGIDAMTPAANLNAICDVTRNWSQFTTLDTLTDEALVREYSAWADIDDEFLFIVNTTDKRTNSALTVDSTIPGKIKNDYNVVLPIFEKGNTLTSAAALSYPASIKWDAEQGMKVLFGKSASGIPASVTDQAVAAVLDANKITYVGQFATRNAEFIFFNKGALTGSLYGWVDVLIGLIWFRAKIQRACMDGFTTVNRIPYNEDGYAMLEAWCMDAIKAAKRVGVIDTGVRLSDAQRAQVTQELGADYADELFSKGWVLQIIDPESAVRAQRGSPISNLYYCYGGSVQKIEMPITQIQ